MLEGRADNKRPIVVMKEQAKKPCGWRRARRPAQKEERRAAILQAAADLLEEQGFDAVSLSAIARRVGLAKSNVYRYFESREEIFLQLFYDDEVEFVTALEAALVPLASSNDAEAIGQAFVGIVVERPRLCTLAAVVASVLERNLSVEVFKRFKSDVIHLSIRISNALRSAAPKLSLEQTRLLQHSLHGLVAGLWPMATPAPVVAEVMDLPEFANYRLDFETTLGDSVVLILRGMLA